MAFKTPNVSNLTSFNPKSKLIDTKLWATDIVQANTEIIGNNKHLYLPKQQPMRD